MKQMGTIHRILAQFLALAMCITMLPAITAATLITANAQEEYIITYERSGGNSRSIKQIDAPESAKAGDTVNITIEAGNSYFCTGLELKTDGESAVLPAVERTMVRDQTSTWSFVMPAANVTVVYKLEILQQTYTVEIEPSNMAEHVTVLGTGTKNAAANWTVQLDNVIDGKYYTIEASATSDESEASTATQPIATKGAQTNDRSNYTVTGFCVSSCVLHIKVVEATAYAINIEPVTGGSLTVSNGTMAQPGDTVTVNLKIENEDNTHYYYDTDVMPTVLTSDGDAVDVSANWNNTADSGTFTFKMPEKPVTVKADGMVAQYKAHKLIISDNVIIKSAEPAEAFKGETVTLTISVPEGKTLLYVTGNTSEDVPYYFYPGDEEGVITFEMPDADLTLTTEAGDYSFWLDDGNYDTSLYQNAGSVINIYNAEQFAAFCKKIDEDRDTKTMAGCTVNLMRDIDLSAHLWQSVSAGATDDYTPWTFNGNGHTISGLHMETATKDQVGRYHGGLFSEAEVNVRDLTVKGVLNLHIPSNGVYYVEFMGNKFGPFYHEAIHADLFGYTQSPAIGSINNVTADLAVTIDGMSDNVFTSLYYAALTPRMGTQMTISNCAALGSLNIRDVNVRSTTIYGLNGGMGSPEVKNNYCLTDITVEDSVLGGGSVSGLFNSQGENVANNYFGGKVSAPDNDSWETGGVIATAGNIYAANYSVGMDAVPASILERYNVDKCVRQDDVAALLVDLNAWVTENQSQDEDGKDIYQTWRAGDDGKPMFGKESDKPASYTITKITGENGDVVVQNSAEGGDEVEFRISPDQLYAVDTVKVYRTDNGRNISYDEDGEGVYFFTMPKSDVTVEVTFKQSAMDVTVEQTGKGRVSVKGQISFTDGKAQPGETVEITAQAAVTDRFLFDSITARTVSGEEIV